MSLAHQHHLSVCYMARITFVVVIFASAFFVSFSTAAITWTMVSCGTQTVSGASTYYRYHNCPGQTGNIITVSAGQGLWLSGTTSVKGVEIGTPSPGFLFYMTDSVRISMSSGGSSAHTISFTGTIQSMTISVASTVSILCSASTRALFRFAVSVANLQAVFESGSTLSIVSNSNRATLLFSGGTVTNSSLIFASSTCIRAANGQPFIGFSNAVTNTSIVFKGLSYVTVTQSLVAANSGITSSSITFMDSVNFTSSNASATGIIHAIDANATSVSVINSTVASVEPLLVVTASASNSVGVSLSVMSSGLTFFSSNSGLLYFAGAAANTSVDIRASNLTLTSSLAFLVQQNNKTTTGANDLNLNCSDSRFNVTTTAMVSSPLVTLVYYAGALRSLSLVFQRSTIAGSSSSFNVFATNSSIAGGSETIQVSASDCVLTGMSFLMVFPNAASGIIFYVSRSTIIVTGSMVSATNSSLPSLTSKNSFLIDSSTLTSTSASIPASSLLLSASGTCSDLLITIMNTSVWTNTSSLVSLMGGSNSLMTMIVNRSKVTSVNSSVLLSMGGLYANNCTVVFLNSTATVASTSQNGNSSRGVIALSSTNSSSVNITIVSSTITAYGTAVVSIEGQYHVNLSLAAYLADLQSSSSSSYVSPVISISPGMNCTLCSVTFDQVSMRAVNSTSAVILGRMSNLTLSLSNSSVASAQYGLVIASPHDGSSLFIVSSRFYLYTIAVVGGNGSGAIAPVALLGGLSSSVNNLGLYMLNVTVLIAINVTAERTSTFAAFVTCSGSVNVSASSLRVSGSNLTVIASKTIGTPYAVMLAATNGSLIAKSNIVLYQNSVAGSNRIGGVVTTSVNSSMVDSVVSIECFIVSIAVSNSSLYSFSGPVGGSTGTQLLVRNVLWNTSNLTAFPLISFQQTAAQTTTSRTVNITIINVYLFDNSNNNIGSNLGYMVTALNVSSIVGSFGVGCSQYNQIKINKTMLPLSIQSVFANRSVDSCVDGSSPRCSLYPSSTVTPSISLHLARKRSATKHTTVSKSSSFTLVVDARRGLHTRTRTAIQPSITPSLTTTVVQSLSHYISLSISQTGSSSSSASLLSSSSLSSSLSVSPYSSSTLEELPSLSLSSHRTSSITQSPTTIPSRSSSLSGHPTPSMMQSLSDSLSSTVSSSTVSSVESLSTTHSARITSTFPHSQSISASRISMTLAHSHTRSWSHSPSVFWTPIGSVTTNATSMAPTSSTCVYGTNGSLILETTSSCRVDNTTLAFWLFPLMANGTSPPAMWYASQLPPRIDVTFPPSSSDAQRQLVTSLTLNTSVYGRCTVLPCQVAVTSLSESWWTPGQSFAVHVTYPQVGTSLPPLSFTLGPSFSGTAAPQFSCQFHSLSPPSSVISFVEGLPGAVALDCIVRGSTALIWSNTTRFTTSMSNTSNDNRSTSTPLVTSLLSSNAESYSQTTMDVLAVVLTPLDVTSVIRMTAAAVTVNMTSSDDYYMNITATHQDPATVLQVYHCVPSVASPFATSFFVRTHLWSEATRSTAVVFLLPQQGVISDSRLQCRYYGGGSSQSMLLLSAPHRMNPCEVACDMPFGAATNDSVSIMSLTDSLATTTGTLRLLQQKLLVSQNIIANNLTIQWSAPLFVGNLSGELVIAGLTRDDSALVVHDLVSSQSLDLALTRVQRFDEVTCSPLTQAKNESCWVNDTGIAEFHLLLLPQGTPSASSPRAPVMSITLSPLNMTSSNLLLRVIVNVTSRCGNGTAVSNVTWLLASPSILVVFPNVLPACSSPSALRNASAQLISLQGLHSSSTSISLNITLPSLVRFASVFIVSGQTVVSCDIQASTAVYVTSTQNVTCSNFSGSAAYNTSVVIFLIDNSTSGEGTQSRIITLPVAAPSNGSSSSPSLWTDMLPLEIVSISGCPLDVYPATAVCPLSGGSNISMVAPCALPRCNSSAIAHMVVNDATAAVVVEFNSPHRVSVPCTNLRVILSSALNASQSSLIFTCTLNGGYGRGGRAFVHSSTNSTTRLVAQSSEGLVNYETWVECPFGPTNLSSCSGNGQCNLFTGRCTCYSDVVRGMWAGSDCSVCSPLYVNSTNCSMACPANPSTGVVCSGLGVCSQGLCTCFVGRAGLACESQCPMGGPSGTLVCSGNGICSQSTATCTCHASPATGYWAGENCGVCAWSYVGPSCSLQCPGSNSTSVCTSHGTCTRSGSAAAASCTCDAGWCGTSCDTANCSSYACPGHRYGPGCASVCPGTDSRSSSSPTFTCSSHGVCNEGLFGTGLCVCDAAFTSTDCSVACPVSLVSSIAVCGGHGTCDASLSLCHCNFGFAGRACDIACPSTQGVVCSGHGVCFDGSAGNGTCSCNAYYSGSDCSTSCLGTSLPCQGHGQCTASGCLCDSSSRNGFWSGAQCNSCQDGWFGSFCLQQCPLSSSNRIPCGGHGNCDPTSLQCKCFSNTSSGFWAGEACDVCMQGYYGFQCNRSCPGSGCAPCNGNGLCYDGVRGNGTCTCFSSMTLGYYQGIDCSRCQSGYFGGTCTSRCPTGIVGVNNNAADCSGHGTCSDGIEGTGMCTCATGFSGYSCSVCADGFFGPSCSACRMNALGIICSGHGTCFDGLGGNGTCLCTLGFGGSYCNFSCPVDAASNRTCGNGNCTAPGTCTCISVAAIGSDGSCSLCASGRWGDRCQNICPLCIKGTCNQANGTCMCLRGYWGALCDAVCPGGVSNPCSGHGVCNASTGTCTCTRSATDGYYTGSSCSTCDVMYLSDACTIRCPVNASNSNLVCNGRGHCWNGTCSACAPRDGEPYTFACGQGCELVDGQCIVSGNQSCPQGFWGVGCSQLCPGSTAVDPAGTSCNGHGVCDAATGVCTCSGGYGGVGCTKSCPRGPTSSVVSNTTTTTTTTAPCSNTGLCIEYSTCTCFEGYWGTACQYVCPGGASSPCNFRGTCSPVLGYCTCDGTAYGLSCALPCPGGFANPCSSSGTCTSSGTCICYANINQGFFAGADCAECAAPFSGSACTVYCDPRFGTVSGRSCVCAEGFVGSDCRLVCPRDITGAICGARGACAEGGSLPRAAVCVCDADYYGSTCQTLCTVDHCKAELQLLRAMCNPASGQCQCQDNDLGHFVGSTCAECADFFWGSECNLDCPCNRHGLCHRDTGVCQCFANDANGHWSGSDCSTCAQGYIGVDCATKNIEFSTAGSAEVSVVNSGYPSTGIVFRDEVTKLVIVGSQPLGVFSYDDWDNATAMIFIGIITVKFPVVACRPWNASFLQLSMIAPSSTTNSSAGVVVTTVLLPRTPEDGLLNASSSSVVVVDQLSAATTTTSQRRMNTLAANGTLSSTRTAVSGLSSRCIAVAVETVNGTSVRITCKGSVYPAVITTSVDVPGTVTWMEFSSSLSSTSLVEVLIIATMTVDDWHIARCVLDADPGSSSQIVLLNATVFDGIRHTPQVCTDAVTSGRGRCRYISACIETTALFSSILCAVSISGSAAQSVLFRVSLLTGALFNTSLLLTNVVNCTAVALDEDYSFAVFASSVDVLHGTSAVVRLHIASMELVSRFDLPMIGGEMTKVLTMYINSTTRTLFLSVATTTLVRAMALNLFGLRAVAPAVFDLQGGVTVTFQGAGLIASPPPVCVFGQGSYSDAVFLNSTTITCRAPPSRTTGTSCERVLVNVMYGNRSTAVASVYTVRPVAALISTAISGIANSSIGWYSVSSRITMIGGGFVLGSTSATCRHVSADGRVVYFTSSVIDVINTTVAVCIQPALGLPTPPGSVIKYSHDGFVYSTTTALFSIAGAYAALEAAWVVTLNSSSARVETIVVLVADVTVTIPPISIFMIDSLGNRLGLLAGLFVPPAMLQISCTAPQLQLAGADSCSHLFVTSDNITRKMISDDSGNTTFAGLALAAPAVGVHTLFAFDVEDLSKGASIAYQVIPGSPARLRIVSQMSSWIDGVQATSTLTPSPILEAIDRAGNVVVDAHSLPSSATLSYTMRVPDATTGGGGSYKDVSVVLHAPLSPDAAQYVFGTVSTRTVFGSLITLQFTADGGMEPLQYTLPQERCDAPFYYAVAGSFECAACPPHALCDGSTFVQPMTGYWRSSDASVVFYACSPPSACASAMTCAEPYEGAACATCAPGFGRSGSLCAPCAKPVTNWLVTCCVVLLLAVIVFLVSLRTLPFSSVSDVDAELVPRNVQGSPIALGVKIAISHLQILALAPYGDLTLPNWLRDVLDGASQGSSTTPNLAYVSCATGSSGMALLTTTVYEMLVVCALLASVGVGMSWWHQRRFRTQALQSMRLAQANGARAIRASAVTFEAVDKAHIAAQFQGNLAARRETEKSHQQFLGSYEGDDIDVCSLEGSNSDEEVVAVPSRSFVVVDALAVQKTKDLTRQKVRELFDHTAKCNVPSPPLMERIVNSSSVAIVVVLFFFYPNVVQNAIKSLQCRVIDLGGGVSTSVMVQDTRIGCDSAAFASIQRAAMWILVAVGLGVPVLSPAIISLLGRFTCKQNTERVLQLFFFATGGYRVWFWESVGMLRKAAVAAATVLAAEGQTRFLLACWILLCAFYFNAVARPWKEKLFERMEGVSLIVLASTFFLFSITFSPAVQGSEVGKTLVYGVCLGVNIAFFAHGMYSLISAAALHLKTLAAAGTNPVAQQMMSAVDDLTAANSIRQLKQAIQRIRRMMHVKHHRQHEFADAEEDIMKDLSAVQAVLPFIVSSSQHASATTGNRGMSPTTVNASTPSSVSQLPTINSTPSQYLLSKIRSSLPKSKLEKGTFRKMAANFEDREYTGALIFEDISVVVKSDDGDDASGSGGGSQRVLASSRYRKSNGRNISGEQAQSPPSHPHDIATTQQMSLLDFPDDFDEVVEIGNDHRHHDHLRPSSHSPHEDDSPLFTSLPRKDFDTAATAAASAGNNNFKNTHAAVVVADLSLTFDDWMLDDDAVMSRLEVAAAALVHQAPAEVIDWFPLDFDFDAHDAKDLMKQWGPSTTAAQREAPHPPLPKPGHDHEGSIGSIVGVAAATGDEEESGSRARQKLNDIPTASTAPRDGTNISTPSARRSIIAVPPLVEENSPSQQIHRTMRNVRRAHAILLALHHINPRRVEAVENHVATDDVDTVQLQQVQNTEAIFSAEVVMLLSWLRLIRLCKQLHIPVVSAPNMNRDETAQQQE